MTAGRPGTQYVTVRDSESPPGGAQASATSESESRHGAATAVPRPGAAAARAQRRVLVTSRATQAEHDVSTSGTLGHCYIALFLAIYHLGYIAPAKLLYSKSAISILCYIATCYIAIL